MKNNEFLKVLIDGFIEYTFSGSRSNKKLKVIHGKIARDIEEKLNKLDNGYLLNSLGLKDNKEEKIEGRYIKNKSVDISISKNNKHIAVVEFKFVMQNYAQNSNNYFENMLGQTANMRSANIHCFQIIVLFKRMPYFDDKGIIKKLEIINDSALSKYYFLSNDREDLFYHSPNKTLLIMLDNKLINEEIIGLTRSEYFNLFDNKTLDIQYSFEVNNSFNELVIFNDYEKFINKIVFTILSK